MLCPKAKEKNKRSNVYHLRNSITEDKKDTYHSPDKGVAETSGLQVGHFIYSVVMRPYFVKINRLIKKSGLR